MAKHTVGIALPKILTMITGVARIEQNQDTEQTTLIYTDGERETAICPENILTAENILTVVSATQRNARLVNNMSIHKPRG